MAEGNPQITLDDEFTFACHKELHCYTSCCRDVTIFLTPYDVIRLKNALGLTSTEFLDKYTGLVSVSAKNIPLVQLRMNQDDQKKCFFLKEGFGCRVYAHRPWACRMFPLDEYAAGGFTVIAKQEKCHGLVQGEPWKVRKWLQDQGATQSKEMDGSWDSLSAHDKLLSLDIENPQIERMLLMALYDLDRFRDFIFNSTFLDRFEVDEDTIEALKVDELALLDMGYAWVRFGLLGQKTLKIKEGAEEVTPRK